MSGGGACGMVGVVRGLPRAATGAVVQESTRCRTDPAAFATAPAAAATLCSCPGLSAGDLGPDVLHVPTLRHKLTPRWASARASRRKAQIKCLAMGMRMRASCGTRDGSLVGARHTHTHTHTRLEAPFLL